MMNRSDDGRPMKMLTIIDEYIKEYLVIVVERRLNSEDVLATLYELFIDHGEPEYIRSDNGSEFSTKAVREWLSNVGVKTLYIEPGSSCENGLSYSPVVAQKMKCSQKAIIVTKNINEEVLGFVFFSIFLFKFEGR